MVLFRHGTTDSLGSVCHTADTLLRVQTEAQTNMVSGDSYRVTLRQFSTWARKGVLSVRSVDRSGAPTRYSGFEFTAVCTECAVTSVAGERSVHGLEINSTVGGC